jgi:hypothetical protein
MIIYLKVYDRKFTDGYKEFLCDNDYVLYKTLSNLFEQGYEIYYTKTLINYHDIGSSAFSIDFEIYLKPKGQKIIKIGGI